jgi:hypothetical protein
MSISKRLERAERLTAGVDTAARDAAHCEWIVLWRNRLEGGGVWPQAGGHVLYPLNWPRTRKAYCALLSSDSLLESLLDKAMAYCLEHDPFQFDANYPLLEYCLRFVQYASVSDEPFRPLAIPAELRDWLMALKPEEYLHYRPCDWCYECGYKYPAVLYGIPHDIAAFLVTRYSKQQMEAMEAPFRGQACMHCGGEIVSKRWLRGKYEGAAAGSKWWADSPAGKRCEANRDEWGRQLDAMELPEAFNYGYLNEEACEQGAEAVFKEGRAKGKTMRIEHKPSVEGMLRMSG